VNVTVENLGPCKKLLRFDVDAQEVDATFEATVKEFQKEVTFPGFRPGKAPREVVLRKHEKEVLEETKRKLKVESFKKGVLEQKISVIGHPDLEEIQFARGQNFQFAATVETAPDFELPEYRGLPAKREMAIVTEADMERALTALRTQRATFQTVERPVQEGDIAVLNYTGTCEGKPISDWAPVAKGLTEKKNFWVEIRPESFIPGFAPQLLGAKAGDKRTVTVSFAADFITKEVAGKQGAYEVEVVEVKERALPPVDDAFARQFGAKDVSDLREGVRRDLQNELNQRTRRKIRNDVINALLGRAHLSDLPETLVQAETKSVVYQIVSENQQRGVSTEVIEQQKDKIYSTAQQTAKDLLKADFLYGKIAQKEGISVTSQEVLARITAMAQANQMAPQAYLKELQKRNGVGEVEMQLLREKVINFLAENAKVEDIAPQT
jgi:trigger factor